MRKRIRESIQAKTFIAMLVLLAGCCIIIYGMVLIFLPKNYRTEMEGQVTEDFYELTETLEAEGVVENFLSAAVMGHLDTVTIIHGKGTGALRKAVHDILRRNKAVKDFRLGVYGEGESGVTVVTLK